jgi:hypothetical protein
MKTAVSATLKILKIGGWFPLAVFSAHVFLSRVLHLYDIYPPMDIPMHFAGGFAIAFFISKCFQILPRDYVKRSRVSLLEILLIGSLTASTAVFWEFAEFTYDQFFGTNIQISLANTIQDLVMGIFGALIIILIRSRQLRIGLSEVREITFDWIDGKPA